MYILNTDNEITQISKNKYNSWTENHNRDRGNLNQKQQNYEYPIKLILIDNSGWQLVACLSVVAASQCCNVF